ncbi:6,7-dimethyl-8-ribityllumazine synthase [Sulfuracidifex metallicus]|jgi:6,7-dimethyl-8-ribityllumazine synthase|uniref:6,7-dimethyl-8-ribityllumazine synthase n=1 Tax=Sulfuracidifex metallicus DSM 6482 = JCM 9184 TaxID=523847 RepID=A0A6A9QM01_SULME|nr:6,7-dimethyl-8-ribityllumazine synthase [Sulfuracidifex metallicus]MCY0850531.1 6,7-dimethyl-8-ribityllumazine synthase [Sulfuracidifex metallicus]MUN28285.1 6,7-dimethyl-8-ribityllumazine synthase [Sulfuracidifex metallicus DSM 6482 = JCM 9184]WOE51182.1 6,7-dimethyl-8-ribityllumazine synthase [Sulfuracidifex metallicus DSM 6482 = JCM 9184]
MQENSVKLGIVVADFNYDITYLMLQKAISHAKFLGAQVKIVFKVPGSYDMPLAVKKLLERDVDAVVTLGAVIRGETKHDEVIGAQIARLIADLSLQYGKPVTLGVIGPGATHEQAVERIEEYANRAVESAVKLALRYKKLETMKESQETVLIE